MTRIFPLLASADLVKMRTFETEKVPNRAIGMPVTP